MSAVVEKEVLVHAARQVVEGILVDVTNTSTGHYRLIFDTGESVVMPGNWQVPFDLWRGMALRAGYENGRFTLKELEEITE